MLRGSENLLQRTLIGALLFAVLLLVGLLPLALAGTLLSGRSADELRSVEGQYQAQLVQDKGHNGYAGPLCCQRDPRG